MQAHQSNVFSAEFLPFNEQHLASGGNDAELKYYNLETEEGTVYSHHTRKVLRMTVHPEHPYSFMSCSADGTVRMIDTRQRYEDSTSGPIETVRGREGEVVPQALGGGRGLRRAAGRTGVPATASLVVNYRSLVPSIQLYCVDFNPSNGYQFIASSDAGDIRLFDLRQIREHSPCSYINLWTHKIGNGDDITGCAFSKDGRTIVATALSDAIYTFDVNTNFEKDQNFPLCLRGPSSRRHPCDSSLHQYTPEMVKRYHDWEEARQSSNHQHRPPFGAEDYGSSNDDEEVEEESEIDGERGNEDDEGGLGPIAILEGLMASDDDDDNEENDEADVPEDSEQSREAPSESVEMEGQPTSQNPQNLPASESSENPYSGHSAAPSRQTRASQTRHGAEEEEEENDEEPPGAVLPNLRDLLGAWPILADEGGDFTIDLETLLRIAATQQRARRQRRPPARHADAPHPHGAPENSSGDASDVRMAEDPPAQSRGQESRNRPARRRSSPYGPEGSSSASAAPSSSSSQQNGVGKTEALEPKIELPQTYKRRITGHASVQTIKGVGFWGPRSEFVVSGSDDANTFIWDTQTGALLNVLEGHDDVVNCVVGHPRVPMLATSGIDDIIKLWDPSGPTPITAELDARIQGISNANSNQRRFGRGIQCAQQ
jgi:WD40 repeat protein